MKWVILILVLTSCANQTTKPELKSITVDIEDQQTTEIEIEKTLASEQVQSEKKKKVVLYLVPAGYHSIAYLKLLDDFTKNNVKIDIVTSAGFSSLVVATYLSNKSMRASYWKLYKLMKEIEEYPMYSASWVEHIEDYIEKELQEYNLDQFGVRYQQPIKKANLTVLSKETKLSKILKSNMKLTRENWMSSPKDYSFFYPEEEYLLIRASAFPQKFKMLKSDGFVWGAYSQIAYLNEKYESVTELISHDSTELDNSSLVIKNFTGYQIKRSKEYQTLIERIEKPRM